MKKRWEDSGATEDAEAGWCLRDQPSVLGGPCVCQFPANSRGAGPPLPLSYSRLVALRSPPASGSRPPRRAIAVSTIAGKNPSNRASCGREGWVKIAW